MRLINCSTLKLKEFFGTNIPRYAILSHTWGDEEVSFADFTTGQHTVRSGYQKILFTCQQATKDGIGYAWVDTCCIDKSSSAELSEAINSMFACIKKDFPKSRWFTRGWTLQEMLALKTVCFYDQQWVGFGTLTKHAGWISKITEIDEAVFRTQQPYWSGEDKFGSYSVATRMSWASTRQTTRAEDMAYCLLGIFNINMPLLYGEGDRAFRRLQEEIIRKIDDDSILAWALSPEDEHPNPLGLMSDYDRVAFGSVSTPMTIAGLSGFQEARYFNSFDDNKRIIVNECKAIRDFGYQLQRCISWKLIGQERQLAYHPFWDPEAKILTIRRDDPFHSMFEFNFETSSSGQNPKFSVFINRYGRGTVREGDVFSEDERRALQDLLGDGDLPYEKDRIYDKGDVMLHDDAKRLFHISVEVHTKTIGPHEMVRVNVDALRDGFSDEDHRWLCNCEKHVYLH
ncbi:uncharacterized protein J4E88_007174 [Alternaria novae-zelandiae]|uniref:uncharacterized protein n=1 Tax=Alternaria novae-zelandiae TaxID=430562 RepID=UPI0020C1F273|nr:uncharacterized protein J4E88_007174 [Alternaria novae-zelandiae]KAI4677366.1 hypothetical protein J4E88_007174 [Alternaria novae-zelandiae]